MQRNAKPKKTKFISKQNKIEVKQALFSNLKEAYLF